MLNIYEALKSFPPFSRQLVCRGMLFTNYECPQQVSKMQVYVEQSIILYVLSGRRVYHWQERSWELKQGACAFVKPGAIVAERPHNEEWCVMGFFVTNEFLLQVINENDNLFAHRSFVPRQSDEPVIPLDVSEISQAGFLSMLPYFKMNPAPPENLVELKFKELVLSLLMNPANDGLVSYLKQFKHKSPVSLHQLMHNNFSYRLTVEDFAKLSCKSVSSFKREFKKHFDDSPARWLMKKRLEKAKHFLRTTSLPVTDIGFECGFENANHFSRVFKEKTGVSPLQFRQQANMAVSQD